MSLFRPALRIAAAVFALLAAHAVPAAPAEIVLAQVSPFSGPLGASGEGTFIGAKACVEAVNAQGGIGGVRIRLVREDDTYKPAETQRLVTLVAARDKPLAFLNLLGSNNVGLLLKDRTLEQIGIPVIGVTPGVESLRDPGSPWLFHVQAGDKAQVNAVLTHLSTVGLKKVAVVYQDNPFGKTGLAFAQEAAAARGVSVLGTAAMPSGADDAKAAAAALAKTGAQAYVMILAPNSAASFLRDVRGAGDSTPLYSLSYLSAQEAVDKAGAERAVGVGVAQITPNPHAPTTRLVRDYQAAMAKYAPPGTTPNNLSLTGYIAARVAVDALQRTGPNATPEAMAAALRKTRLDLGGYVIDLTGGNIGSRMVDIAVIDRRGTMRF